MLLARVVEDEERGHLREVLTKLHDERGSIEEVLSEHQLRLDLCLQLRLYEADVSDSYHFLGFFAFKVLGRPYFCFVIRSHSFL